MSSNRTPKAPAEVAPTDLPAPDDLLGGQPSSLGSPTFWKRWGAFLVFATAIGLIAWVPKSEFLLHALIMACLWAGAGSSWNILGGFGGQLSFGHAAFFGTGAYTMAILIVHLSISPWLALLAAGAVSAILAAAIGVPAFRLRGPYFALATLAFAEAVRILIVYWRGVTRGNSGLLLPTDPGLANMYWTTKLPFVYLMLGYMVVAYAFSVRMRYSRFGYFLLAVREDEDAAAVSGVNPTAIKTRAALVSGFIAGLGGALLARYVSIAEPIQFLLPFVSVLFIVVVIVGGRGTVGGPIVGAFVVMPLGELLRSTVGSSMAGGLHLWIYGILFVLMVMLLPQGLGPGIAGLFTHGRAHDDVAQPAQGSDTTLAGAEREDAPQ